MSYSRASEYSKPEQLIATYSKILAHPARIRILSQLASEPLSLRQLTEDQPLPRQTVMRHLNVLITSGLVAIGEPNSPATYNTNTTQWPLFITNAVRLANRFIYANAA